MSPLRRRGFDTRESRRRILYEEFGFACRCDTCDNRNVNQPFGKKKDSKEKARKAISYPWKQSVHLKSPVKTLFHSPRHVTNLLSGTHKSQILKERDELSVVVPKGVIITRIEP